MELKERISDKKVFAKIGLAILVCMLITSFVQGFYLGLLQVIDPNLLEKPWTSYLGIAISFYAIGFPLFCLMVKKLPNGEKKEVNKLSIGKVITLFIISYAIVYVVNFATTMLIMLVGYLKGSEVINPLEETLGASNWIWSLIFVGILSPIIEELLFRGVMLNKIRAYGDKVAILTTAIIFGLFHGNFSQFFYATALGIVFAYVALKTGTIKYSIMLHIGVYIVGSVIMPAIVGDGSNVLATVLAGLAIIIVSIVGIVLLVLNTKNISLADGDIKLEKGTAFKTIWLNVGMIVYVIICLVSMISILFI